MYAHLFPFCERDVYMLYVGEGTMQELKSCMRGKKKEKEKDRDVGEASLAST